MTLIGSEQTTSSLVVMILLSVCPFKETISLSLFRGSSEGGRL